MQSDLLHGKIITYLGKIGQTKLTEAQTTELMKLMEATNDLENIGDIIETNMVALGNRRILAGVTVSEATQEVLRGVHAEVLVALESAMLAVSQKNEQAARAVVGMKAQINTLVNQAARHQASRLVAEEPNRGRGVLIRDGCDRKPKTNLLLLQTHGPSLCSRCHGHSRS